MRGGKPAVFDSALMLCGALLMALAVDRLLGEPTARLHPVVWMGNYLNWAARRLQPEASDRKSVV